jgi:hypothetical protein
LPVVRALAQLSETMIMLADAGELGYARAIHEVIGRLLLPDDRHESERGANVIALGSPRGHERSR